jgi:intermembrane space import and assembly protein 40
MESVEAAATESASTPSSSSKSTPTKKPKSEFVDEHEHNHDHSDPAHKHDHDHDHSTEGSEGSEEASEEGGFQGGAYNPETGEINWDCPCLGGMAHGPCGPQFREAFACFIHSEEDPKGIDCVEKFKGMQECFREHPEVYAEGQFSSSFVICDIKSEMLIAMHTEIMDDDEEDDAAPAAAGADASAPSDGELAEARQAAAEGSSDWTAPTGSKPTTASGKEPHASTSGTA